MYLLLLGKEYSGSGKAVENLFTPEGYLTLM